MLNKLDHCPRDPGCTSSIVWRDSETKELFSFRTKQRKDRRSSNGEFQYDHDIVPHVCTNKVVGTPTTFFLTKWHNDRTGFERFVGPKRLLRSALIPPADSTRARLKDWSLVSLMEIRDVEWKEIPVPEEFTHVPLTIRKR